MTLDELHSALDDALKAGEIGVPVSLRLHVQLAAADTDAVGLLSALMPLAERAFGSQPQRLMVRRCENADQLSVLFDYAGGQTCFVTAGKGCTKHSSLQLVLFGNHGVVRLEEGQLVEPESFRETGDAKRLRELIDQCVAGAEPIVIPRN